MSKKPDYRTALRETMDRMDEFYTSRPAPGTFGKKTHKSPEEVDARAAARLKSVQDRARGEDTKTDMPKKFGFLKSLKKNVFGKKTVDSQPEVNRPEKSYADRLRDIIDRAKSS